MRCIYPRFRLLDFIKIVGRQSCFSNGSSSTLKSKDFGELLVYDLQAFHDAVSPLLRQHYSTDSFYQFDFVQHGGYVRLAPADAREEEAEE